MPSLVDIMLLCICPMSWLVWLPDQKGINHLYPAEGSSGNLWIVQVLAMMMEGLYPREEYNSAPFNPSHEREKWPNPSNKSSEVRCMGYGSPHGNNLKTGGPVQCVVY